MAVCLHGDERKPVLMGGTGARRAAISGVGCQQGNAGGIWGDGHLGRQRNGQREATMAGKGQWWIPREVVD